LRVIPVLDLRAGRAVLASRGRREAYGPVRSVLVAADTAGDPPPVALARAFRDRLGCAEWYVADLDAISGAAPQRPLVRALAALGGQLLVDAGVSTAARARETLVDGGGVGGAARVVIGLETLPSFAALDDLARAIGPERLVFSLDLREGKPVLHPGASHQGPPAELARTAVDGAGVPAVLVLDLARIGSAGGVNLDLVAALRRAHPGIELLAGGGIGSVRDLERLADAGCDGALVATALHDGSLAKKHIDAVRRR
jgi:phosphoribosylformimino-5-aminoimidazole carboxamide ribotide isomerase